MTGRIFGIKKSTLLRASAIIYLLAFIAFIFVSIYIFKAPEIWFYGFCIFVGVFQLCKACLFKFDSSLYLGSLLSSIGSVGFISTYTNTTDFIGFYISLAFTLASVATYLFTKQKSHLVFAFSTIYVSLYSFLYVKNLITYQILIAFTVPFLVLLILEIIWICFHKK
ncbi:MAG: hypothetical protein J6K39_01765 [Clostridia bacterium]|nr:hypothetical protein [Clostridia bacterium]